MEIRFITTGLAAGLAQRVWRMSRWGRAPQAARLSGWTSAAMLIAIFGSTAFAQDVVELFNGQTVHGSLTDSSLQIKTRLGVIDVPSGSVLNLVCAPPPRLSQVLTTRDGDVLVGRLASTSIHLRTAEGAIELPLDQISRLGGQASTPTTAPAQAAEVYTLRGDRLAVAAPATIEFRTRWGPLNLSAAQVREIVFCTTNQVAHRIVLSDGSALAGLMTADSITFQPANLQGPALTVSVGELSKLVLTAIPSVAAGPRLDMAGGDVFRGALQGTFTMQTDYGDVSLAAGDIVKIAAVPDSAGDLVVNMTDGRVVRGAPQEESVTCKLDSGVSLAVPAAMIAAYARSAGPSVGDGDADAEPGDNKPSDAHTAIAQWVSQLASGEQSVRQNAQNQLVILGPAAIEPLRRLRPAQPQRVKSQITAVITRIRNNQDAN
jgi:hypothetical protein